MSEQSTNDTDRSFFNHKWDIGVGLVFLFNSVIAYIGGAPYASIALLGVSMVWASLGIRQANQATNREIDQQEEDNE